MINYEDVFGNQLSLLPYEGEGTQWISLFASDVHGGVNVEVSLAELEEMVRKVKEGK